MPTKHGRGMNAVKALHQRVLHEGAAYTCNKSERILLAQLERSPLGMHPNTYKVIIIPNWEFNYVISMRMGAGARFTDNVDEAGDRLSVHRDYGIKQSVRESTNLKPGSSYTLGDGVRLEYEEHSNCIAKIKIVFGDDTDVPEVEIPQGFPQHIAGATLGPQHTGLWVNQWFPDQGCDIEIYDDWLYFYMYTGSKNGLEKNWFNGACPVGDGLEEFNLHAAKGGTFNTPQNAVDVPAGRAQLYFLGDDIGVLNYDMPQHGNSSVLLTPLERSKHPQNGQYVVEGREKDGMTAKFLEGGNRVVLFLFTYRRAPAFDGWNRTELHTQTWLIMTGAKVSDSQYSLTITEVFDVAWQGFEKGREEKVGEASLFIQDIDHLQLVYDFDADGLEGAGLWDMVRANVLAKDTDHE